MPKPHYLHGIVQTFEAPSSNYRGESDGGNRTPIQKLNRQVGDEVLPFAYLSSTTIRHGLRETMRSEGSLMNRERLLSEGEPTVRYEELPNPNKYDDDLVFGYMVVSSKEDPVKSKGAPLNKNSIIGVTHAVAVTPYMDDLTLHQSPGPAEDSAVKNASGAALFNAETSFTSYQYSWGLMVEDFSHKDLKFRISGKGAKVGTYTQDKRPEALQRLLASIADPGKVSGNHARTLYSFEPRNLVVRCTESRNPHFGRMAPIEELFDRLREGDLPPSEFWFAGEVVRKRQEELIAKGVPTDQLFASPVAMMSRLYDRVQGWIS